jgi:hypothetical protein
MNKNGALNTVERLKKEKKDIISVGKLVLFTFTELPSTGLSFITQ